MIAPREIGCRLCGAIADSSRSSPMRRIYNTPLWRGDHFTILPSLGPLAVGHVMAVSNEHHSNLAAMAAEALQEYRTISEVVGTQPLYNCGGFIAFESGGSEQNTAGGCVVHTHIHYIPAEPKLWLRLAEALPHAAVEKPLQNISQATPPYFLAAGYWPDGETQGGLFNQVGLLPGQFARRTLADFFDVDHWDYWIDPRPDRVAATVQNWS